MNIHIKGLALMDKYCIHVYKRVSQTNTEQKYSTCPICGSITHDYNWTPVNIEHKEWVSNNPDWEYEVWSI